MSSPAKRRYLPTSSHWGPYVAQVESGKVVAMHAAEDDAEPSLIGDSFVGVIDDACRIPQPMVRQGYLGKGFAGGGSARGAEPFVPVSWEEALELVAQELGRVRRTYGNEAIFAGSYGWASAGRFHHALYQIHRFLNLFGGFTNSVNAYSYAAAEVVLPHVVGDLFSLQRQCSSWPVIADNTELIVMFGGMPAKNAQVGHGGIGRHTTRKWLRRCHESNISFVNMSPIRDDADDFLNAEWMMLRPNTDVAVMLGLAHTLVTEGLHDPVFLSRHSIGFDRFLPYLLGETDGQAKDAEWSSRISGLEPGTIRQLARRMATKRTLISVAWSLQRADHGEQPYWMAVTLAAILGQIGLPGGGFGFGYRAVNGIGNPTTSVRWASLDTGNNPVETRVPVARFSDMLLDPGGHIDYNGCKITFPDIKLVYWAGGNPFHHHQDLNRLLAAWRRPETIIIHDIWWNASTRHADIVLPVTTTLERNDISFNPRDGFALAMHKAMDPLHEARSDFDIFSDLAARLGFEEEFTENRSEMDWLRHLYSVTSQRAARQQIKLPEFEVFWKQGKIQLPVGAGSPDIFAAMRREPGAHPLPTPSGRIEIFSETIDSFGYEDCPGHPTWLEPAEWLGGSKARDYPLHLISNQPRTRLHSQLDNGAVSRESKVSGHEPMRIHPAAAAKRGIADGDVVRLYNDRGACLAGAVLSEDVHPQVVQLSTGAWYDPDVPGTVGALDRHGNPNVLTLNKGTSRLAQGPVSNSALVEVERYAGDPSQVAAFRPPRQVER